MATPESRREPQGSLQGHGDVGSRSEFKTGVTMPPRDGRKPKDEVVIVFRPRTPAGPGDAKEKKTDGP